MKASSVGILTEPHLRNEKVAHYMKIKMIFLNCLLFVNFGIGIVALAEANLFYACFHERENDSNSLWREHLSKNITQVEYDIVNVGDDSNGILNGTSTWMLFFLLLQITQATEVMYSIISLLRLFGRPKGVHSHLTLEEFARSGGDHSQYNETFHHHEQDHMGLYDALWEERCKFWCKCSGQATCFLFGGKEVGSGDYGDISRILTDYFEHGGTLDIVPSDIAAAFIVLQKIQRQRMLSSRKSIVESRNSILNSMSSTESFHTKIQTEFGSELKIPITPNSSSASITSSDTFFSAHMINNNDSEIDISSCTDEVIPQIELNSPCILVRDRRTDREIIGEGARFARHALAIYTWMLYVYMKPIRGFFDLVCTDLFNRKSKHPLNCHQYSCDDLYGSTNDCMQAPSPELMDRNLVAIKIKGDMFGKFHKKALLKQAGLRDSDIVYAQFENGLEKTPYCIILDHKWKSIVLAIRGTLSLEDCVMDVLVGAQPLDDLGNSYGFDGDGEYIHSGIFHSTQWIIEDMKQ